MKISRFLILALAWPAALAGQDTLAAAPEVLVEVPPPAGLAAAELARSRRCVPVLAQLDSLNTRLAPLALRADRIRLLNDAVLLEDSTRVVPFAAQDSVEAAVRDWFIADQALARQYAETGDSLLDARRGEGRERLQQRLAAALVEVNQQGQAIIAAAGDLELGARECQGVILVRPAVLEVCATVPSPVCAEARLTEPSTKYKFVDAAEDLWDIESIDLWNQPARLAAVPQGGLAGAQTTALARRGNLMLAVSLEPMIRDRSEVPAAEQARIQINLDSLGVTFNHAQYLIAPALAVELEVSEPLGGETYYFLHFGDLSDPTRDVIWTSPALGRPIQDVIPLGKSVLDRLAAGEPVALTAVKFPDAAAKEGEGVYVIELTEGGQAQAASALREYFSSGQLGQDFTALLPPAGG